jgi:hypothetical protein
MGGKPQLAAALSLGFLKDASVLRIAKLLFCRLSSDP